MSGTPVADDGGTAREGERHTAGVDVPFPLELPLVDDVTRGWWDATRRRRLVVQRCRACANAQHYPRALCTVCGSSDLGFDEALGTGVVVAATTVHRPPHPALNTPYVIALVDLAEGPRMLTRLVDVAIGGDHAGRPVSVDWWPLPDGRALPVFGPGDGTPRPVSDGDR